MAERLAGGLRDARLVEVPGAYHHLVLDQPEAFTKAVLEFLDDLDARESGRRVPIRPAAS
jgi:pimeloyl-ACP methyl ester carboxylesterase